MRSACKPATSQWRAFKFLQAPLSRTNHRPTRAHALKTVRAGSHATTVVDLPAMKAFLCASLMLLCTLVVAAQEHAVATQTQTSGLGFRYTLPADWEVVNSNPTLGDVKKQAQQSASTDDEKKGVACVQLALTARHGDPASVIVIVALPFACFGQSMTTGDLPGFAQGAAEGIKQTFDITDTSNHDYKLGSHPMWLERAKGIPKGHPEAPPYTVEIACTLLTKGAVCWMALAADDAALRVFEGGSVALESDVPTALVPAAAFQSPAAP